MINNVTLVGRAGKDPESKTFASGSKVVELSMALSRYVKGQDKPATDWFQIKLWGKLGETAEKFIKKGHLFGIVGELQVETWDEGKKSKVVVVARDVRLMQPKEGGQQAKSGDASDIFGSSEDEIPF